MPQWKDVHPKRLATQRCWAVRALARMSRLWALGARVVWTGLRAQPGVRSNLAGLARAASSYLTRDFADLFRISREAPSLLHDLGPSTSRAHSDLCYVGASQPLHSHAPDTTRHVRRDVPCPAHAAVLLP